MTPWDKLARISSRFAGFSLERRQEWKEMWRIRILPNKGSRQQYRITAHGSTLEEVIERTWKVLESLDDVLDIPPKQYVATGNDLGVVLQTLRDQVEEDRPK